MYGKEQVMDLRYFGDVMYVLCSHVATLSIPGPCNIPSAVLFAIGIFKCIFHSWCLDRFFCLTLQEETSRNLKYAMGHPASVSKKMSVLRDLEQ